MMGTAILKLDGVLLRHALHLPSGADLMSLNGNRVVEVIVHHESIPDDAIAVVAVKRTIHGMTVFDHFHPIAVKGKVECGDQVQEQLQ